MAEGAVSGRVRSPAEAAALLQGSIAMNMAAIAGQDRSIEVDGLFFGSRESGGAAIQRGGAVGRSISELVEHAGRWERHSIEGRANAETAEKLRGIAGRAAAEFGIIILVGETFETANGRYANYAIMSNAYIPKNLGDEDRQFLMGVMRLAESYIGTDIGRAREMNDLAITYIKSMAWLEGLQQNPPSTPELPGWTGPMRDIFPEIEEMPENCRWMVEGFAERGFRAIEDATYSRMKERVEEAVGHLRNGLEQMVSGGDGTWAVDRARALLGEAMDIREFSGMLGMYAGQIDQIRRSWQGLARMGRFDGVTREDSLKELRALRDRVVELEGNAQWHLTRSFFLTLAGRSEEALVAERDAEASMEQARDAIGQLNGAYQRAWQQEELAKQYREAAEGLGQVQFEGVQSPQALMFLKSERDGIAADLRRAADQGIELQGLEERVNALEKMYQNAREYEALVRAVQEIMLRDVEGVRQGLQGGVQAISDFWHAEDVAALISRLPNSEEITRQLTENDLILGEIRDKHLENLRACEAEVRAICGGLLSAYSPAALDVREGTANLAQKFGFESTAAYRRLMSQAEWLADMAADISDMLQGQAAAVRRTIQRGIPPNIYALPGVEACETLATRINSITAIGVLSATPALAMGGAALWKAGAAALATRTGAALLEYAQMGFTGFGAYELSTGAYEYFSASTEAERQEALDHLRNGALLIGIPATRLAGIPNFINRAVAAAAPFMRTTAFATGGVVLAHDIARWSNEGVDPLTLAMDVFAMAAPLATSPALRGVARELFAMEAVELAPAAASVGGRLPGIEVRVPGVMREAGFAAGAVAVAAEPRVAVAFERGEALNAPVTIENFMRREPVAAELMRKATIDNIEWIISGDRIAGNVLWNEEVFREIEKILRFEMQGGSELDMLVISADKNALTAVNEMFGSLAGDATISMYMDIWRGAARSISESVGGRAAYLVRNGTTSDEVFIVIVGEDLRIGEEAIRSAVRAGQVAAERRAASYAVGEMEITLEDVGRCMARRAGGEGQQVMQATSFGFASERVSLDNVDGSIRRLLTVADDMEVPWAVAMREAAGIGTRPGISPSMAFMKLDELPANEQVSGIAVEVGIGMGDAVAERMGAVMGEHLGMAEPLSLAEIASIGTRKAYSQIAGNSMRFGALNSIFGHGGANVLIQHVDDGVAQFAAARFGEEGASRVVRASGMRYVIRGGTMEDAAALQAAVDNVLRAAGLDMHAAVRAVQVERLSPAALNTGLNAMILGEANMHAGNALISFISVGTREPAAVEHVLGAENVGRLEEIIQIIRSNRSIRGMDDLMLYFEQNGLPGLADTFRGYLDAEGAEMLTRLSGLPAWMMHVQ